MILIQISGGFVIISFAEHSLISKNSFVKN